ncbi:MAG: alanine--tRNA ligase [Candidatus Muirbacterium halophilum]|nr:alanine--tRNA ligase [Candidatus Muirbacterium halophilum]MCK9474578.1 alanine--tRNA ligase [Candidatus Muirbacterium halophilum]
MKYMTSAEIRESFLSFFENKEHKRVESSSLVPANDPTLLFTNAGMNQFKDVFEGKENRDYKSAVSCQKCVRAGGKHNDLDNVGYTARHQTFFEMLGNFSFSHYFKREAISFAWEYLTEILEIPAERLYVSVFREDDEAFDIWNKEMNISSERIFKFDEKDNFWAMGPTGPCGPNSEIFYDFGEKYGCNSPNCTVGCECDRYVEIWNNVFMQFERFENGDMKPLPQPGIDTGMGLERIAAVVQGVHSNYETDVLSLIIEEIEKICNKKCNRESMLTEGVAFKVVADHARCAVFLIGDGIMPSNEGRGYVLRRIIRRAVRYSNILTNEMFIYKLVSKIVELMGNSYCEIKNKMDFIETIIKKEEELFSNTLKQGLKILDDMLERYKNSNNLKFSGKDVFVLYDTYGFPYDLTEIILKEKNINIDEEEYKESMQEQKKRSRENWKGNSLKLETEEFFKLKEKIGEVEFIGYDELICDAEIKYINKNMLITSKTPFYGESGGQVGDTGKVLFGGGDSIEIIDTVKPVDGLIIHICDRELNFEIGEKIRLEVDKDRRNSIQRNHSATHLLHLALRNLLGPHAEQSGSYVGEDRLRFDFKHFQAMTNEEITKVEEMVNRLILENKDVSSDHFDVEEAKKIGATALFGEKYGQKVRVVQMGDSKEFCGGAHTKKTGDIGFFKIISETSIAASIRRIEAVCGLEALKYIQAKVDILDKLSDELKVKHEDIPNRVVKFMENIRDLKKELKNARLNATTEDSVFEKKIGDYTAFVTSLKGIEGNTIRDVADILLEGKEKSVGVVLSENKGKVGIVIKVTRDATSKIHAGNIMKELTQFLSGKGGGKPDMAQGGASYNENFGKASEKVIEIIEKAVN